MFSDTLKIFIDNYSLYKNKITADLSQLNDAGELNNYAYS